MAAPVSNPTPLPNKEYLELLGEFVYTITYMEWQLLGDLAPLSVHEPLTRPSNKLPRCACYVANPLNADSDPLQNGGAAVLVPLTSDILSKCPTGALINTIMAAAKEIKRKDIQDYLLSCCSALEKAASVRNDILHANPISHGPESEQLLHRRLVKPDGRLRSITFTVDALRRSLTDVVGYQQEMSKARANISQLLNLVKE